MFPVEFEYEVAGSVSEAIALLQRYPGDAKIVAGGHSLLPMMKLRLAQPPLLVDIARIPELKGIRRDGEMLHIGALTTQTEVQDSALVQQLCPCSPRRPPTWATRRCGTGARSAARWRTGTRRRTCPRRSWRWRPG